MCVLSEDGTNVPKHVAVVTTVLQSVKYLRVAPLKPTAHCLLLMLDILHTYWCSNKVSCFPIGFVTSAEPARLANDLVTTLLLWIARVHNSCFIFVSRVQTEAVMRGFARCLPYVYLNPFKHNCNYICYTKIPLALTLRRLQFVQTVYLCVPCSYLNTLLLLRWTTLIIFFGMETLCAVCNV